MAKRYVITGGPGFGKTTIINELEKLGYHCFHEFSRTLKNEDAIKSGELISWIKLDEQSQDNFSLKVCKKRVEQFLNAPANVVSFYDRGIPDVVAYLRIAGQDVSPFYKDAITNHVYENIVFFTPPWKDIFINDNERIESFEEASEANNYLESIYKELGYKTLNIPFESVENRIKFIISHVKQ